MEYVMISPEPRLKPDHKKRRRGRNAASWLWIQI